MRWNDKRLYGAATLALMVGGAGVFGGSRVDARTDRADRGPVDTAPVLREEQVRVGDPYTIQGQRFEPRDDNTFDETGYASISAAGEGSETSSGEGFRASAISGSHRVLPIPSYVEVTHLETGRTILVRINDRGPMVKDRVMDLSPGAARMLGMDGSGSIPVRVRRVNPPFPERAALRLGNPAQDRLDTPPALLSALKRRLIESGQPKPKDASFTPPPPRPVRPAVVAQQPAPAPVTRPGADFDDVPAPAPVRAAPRAVPRSAPPAPVTRGGDRFIIEGNGVRVVPAPRAGTVRAAPPAAVPVEPAPPPASYVQIASFSTEARARALADKVGGKVENAGTAWRVRTGPYPSEAAARAALSQAVAKGYRDARITR